MPADPAEAFDIARGIADVLGEGEARLLELVGGALVDGIDSPDWDVRALQRVQGLRRRLDEASKVMAAEGSDEIRRAILDAWQAGADSASADLLELTTPARQPRQIRDAALLATQNLISQGERTIGQLAVQASFRSERIYRDTVRGVVAQATVGAGVTRRDTTARVLEKLAQRGVTTFTDRRGRAWDMAAYGEMTTRTTTSQALISGHVDQLADAGRDLVMVSDAPQECVRCRPFEGKILSAGGRTKSGTYTEDGAEYNVAGSVADARRAGLFHPNCRHRLTAYLPGITPPLLDTEDPEGDELRQIQRAKERAVRRARRELAVQQSLGAPGAKAARAKLAEKQRDLKGFVQANGLKNLAYRTRPDIGNVKVTGRPDRSAPLGPFDAGTRTPAAERGAPSKIPDRNLPTRRRKKREPPADVRDRNARELRDVSDDDLDQALTSALATDHPGADRLIAEVDRREEAPFKAQRRREARKAARLERLEAEQAAKAARLAELVEQGADERDAIEQVFGVSIAQQQRIELTARLRSEGTPGKTLDQMIRHTYKREQGRLYVAAEDATRGQMLNKDGIRAAVDPASFFNGTTRTEARVRRYASRELLEWFDENGFPTLAEWRDQLLTGRVTLGKPIDDFLT